MKTHNILSIDEFKTNIENNSRLLGIDPGGKNVGIAICDENKKVATPLKIIQKSKFQKLLKEINEIIEENHIKGIIIGNPINMDGSLGKSSQSASDFAKNISNLFLFSVINGVATILFSSHIAIPIFFLPGSIPNNLELLAIFFLNSSILNILYVFILNDNFILICQ